MKIKLLTLLLFMVTSVTGQQTYFISSCGNDSATVHWTVPYCIFMKLSKEERIPTIRRFMSIFGKESIIWTHPWLLMPISGRIKD